ncbi:GNAT family N-acetyltransferase [Vibrio sp. SCSIO 43136]|uniref:GNAT family N-acetyltransferase n=1 Tax=Vibrio sp. SCSIO 43136 TaxID=2819101 RepID=UPI0020755917|nr:GNAT family N-acetyltransferase [Vibrio sp. SCSIO 43136]USD67341.1 GNAT family N-acetyltransferase [Vibrio sp. SCSIO 43136]
MEFLAATPAHYEQIGQLISSPEELYKVSAVASFPWDVVQIAEIAQQRLQLTVAIDEGRVVAFGNLYDVKPTEQAFIGNVIVADSHKGKGIGKAMIEVLSAKCREHYQVAPSLSVFNYNTPALMLYHKLGFVPYGCEPRVSQTGETVMLIHMRLSS